MAKEIIYRKLTELKKLPNNPRTIKKDDMERLKKSIKDNPDYFEARPIILSNRTGDLVILAGNQRYEAAKALKMEEVPTFLLEGLTEARERGIIIRDNVSNGDWDMDALANEWDTQELSDWGLDLDWEEPEQEVVEDEAPEVNEKEPADSELGKVYQLGEHRLMCGDSTDAGSVAILMDGEKADMAFTDPPYGVDVVSDGGKVGADFGVAKKGVYSKVIADDTTETAEKSYHILKNFSQKMIIWGGNYFVDFLDFSDGWLIWDKRGDTGIRNTFADGEMAWCSFHTPVRIYKQLWNGMIREGEHEQRVHPTQKPIKMLGEVLKDFTKDSETVLDVFGGSGSTLIACEQLGRKCYMMELDPKYCDVIRKRYWKFTTGSEEGWQDGTKAV
ncbi:DNA modification methylase [Fibrobacter sp.]|uniref:DNA modification methylase n=1 Tax=Fibrobacter sp. TaxID=35828 RepID=UPI00388D6AC5